MVGQQLQGDDCEDPLQAVNRLGHLQNLRPEFTGFFFPLIADDDGPALSGGDLLHGIHGLHESVVPHADHDDGHPFVHKGQGTVFELPGEDSFAVHVRDFLDLEGALQAGCEVVAPAEHQHGLLFVYLLGDLLDLVIESQHLFDLLGEALEALDDFRSSRLRRYSVFGHHEAEHD